MRQEEQRVSFSLDDDVQFTIPETGAEEEPHDIVVGETVLPEMPDEPERRSRPAACVRLSGLSADESVLFPETAICFAPAVDGVMLTNWDGAFEDARQDGALPVEDAVRSSRVSAMSSDPETSLTGISPSGEEAVRSASVAEWLNGTTGNDVFSLEASGTWGAYHVARWNGTAEMTVSLAGRNRFQDVLSGRGGYDVVQLPEGDNAFLYRDLLSPKAEGADGAARFVGLTEIIGNSGDDVIDLTAAAGGSYGDDILIKGGAGDDHLWGGTGSDVFIGGAGNDDMRGGQGDDIYLFGADWGQDVITDNGGYLIFDSSFKNRLSLTQAAGGTRITAQGNSLEMNWYVGQDDIYFADVEQLSGYTLGLIKQIVETQVLPPDVNPDF